MRHLLKIAASSLLLFGMAAAPAMAGDHDRHDRRGGYGHHDRDHDDDDDRRRHRHDRYDARYDRHAYRYDRYDRRYDRRAPRVVYVQPRVIYRAAPHPRWVRGGRYYGAGYAPTYVVNDWRGYGLRTPPRGHYWRRSDSGDYLLVALATGIIADIILDH